MEKARCTPVRVMDESDLESDRDFDHPETQGGSLLGLTLQDGALRLNEDLEAPSDQSGEVLLNLRLAGICRTDLELVAGYYPFSGVLGHEFVAEVISGSDQFAGQRVVGEINACCYSCDHCRSGRQNHCPQRTVLGIVGRNGCFSQQFLLPERNLHLIPEHVPDESAVFVEPLAAAFRIVEQVSTNPQQKWLVVGDGRLGQMVARVLKLQGVELTVLGRHSRKLELLQKLGIHTTKEVDAVIAESGDFDFAVDCAGNSSGFDLARRSLRPQGTLILKSTYAGSLEMDASACVVDELTVLGSRCGPFQPAIEALASGDIDPRDLLDAEFPLHSGLEAFEKASQKGVMKVLIRP